MGWIGKWRNLSKFILFVIFAFVGLINISFAQEDWREKVNSLLEAEKYDEAYAIVSDTALDEDTAAHMIRGTLLGFGLLSSGQDICAAVLNFEKIPLSHISLRWALDYLYGGEWARIAANEGNPQALYIVGKKLLEMGIIEERSIVLFSLDKQLAIKNAYSFFYNAALLGHKKAKEKLAELEAAYLEIDFTKYQTKMLFRESLCPVRKVVR